MSLLKKGISDSKYYLIASIGNKALAFFIIPILAKSVGVKEFATYDLFLLISAFLNIFAVLGTDSGITILVVESKDDKEALSFLYVVTLVLVIGVILFASVILHFIFLYRDELFLLKENIWNYILLYVLFTTITYHSFNFLRWQERARDAAFVTLFSYVAGMLMGLLFLFKYGGIEEYIKGLVLGVSIGMFISLYISREYILNFKVVKEATTLIKDLMRLSLPFVPNYLGNDLMQMADRIVILTLFTKYELGIYAVIVKIAMIPQVLIGTIAGGFLPVMFKNYQTNNGKRLIKNFYHFYLIFIPIAFLIAYFASDWVVELFASREYVKYAYLLPIALISILFVQSHQANGLGYPIKRKTHYVMYITFFTIILNYSFSLILGYYIGLEGVIIGTLIAGIIKTYLFTFISEKLYPFEYNLNLILFVSIISFILIFISSGKVV